MTTLVCSGKAVFRAFAESMSSMISSTFKVGCRLAMCSLANPGGFLRVFGVEKKG